MGTEGEDDGIDAMIEKTERTRPRPRPPRPVVPGDLAPRVGRVVAVRKAYDRYLSVEQRDVEVEVGGGKEVISYDVVSHPKAHCAFVVAFPFHPARGGGGGGGDDGDGDRGDASTSAAAASAAAAPPSTSAPTSSLPTVTLLREYCHGINAWLYTLPTGGLDPKKHRGEENGGEKEGGEKEGEEENGGGIERAAAAELSEEARLEGGDWECLLPNDDDDDDDEEEEEEEEGPSSPLFRNPLSEGIPEAKWCANRFWPFLVVGSEPAANPGARDREETLGTMEVLRVTIPELERIILKGRMLLPSVQTSWMALERLREKGLLV